VTSQKLANIQFSCCDLGRNRILTVRFNPTKGCAFIKPMAGEKDVFVHISAVERAGLSTLNENQVAAGEIRKLPEPALSSILQILPSIRILPLASKRSASG
jgi:cold shock CspA family protein